MMNFADLVLCLLTGFAIPLALSGFVAERAVVHAGRREMGPAGRFLVFWSSALVCGPGLFATRLVEGFRSREETAGEQITGWLAAAGWAFLYGYVVLTLVRRAFHLP